MDMGTPKPKRLYQVWKGSNRFFCGGRLIFGPDVASFLLSILLIVAPSVAFCSQVITKIHTRGTSHNKEEVHGQKQILGTPTLIIAILVTIADLIFLILTSSRDPGIVPRNTRPPESDKRQINVIIPSTDWVYGKTPPPKLPRIKDALVNGVSVKVKYCDTCLLYRPPRASHCSICNNCVQKFDHHCPWVGQCIGLRNYRFFFSFISSSTFLCIYVFTFSWLNILEGKRNYGNSILKAMQGEVLSVILIVYTFFSVWFVGGLTIFHLYLISTNQTTYENFRYSYDKKENLYNKGLLSNFKDVFFSKIPASMNDFRSHVLDDIMENGLSATNTKMCSINQKEKINIEISSKFETGGKVPTPSILKNLDYCSIDNKLQGKDMEDFVSAYSSFPEVQDSIVEEPRYSYQRHAGENNKVTDEWSGEGISSNSF